MKKSLSLRLAAIPAAMAFGMVAAQAAVPSEVSSSLTTMGEDAKSLAVIVLGAIAIVFAIKFMRKGF